MAILGNFFLSKPRFGSNNSKSGGATIDSEKAREDFIADSATPHLSKAILGFG